MGFLARDGARAYCRPVPLGSAPLRALERVNRVCGAHEEQRTLRGALLEEVRRAVGFDAYAWLLTDPETEVGATPLADVPCLPELPRLIRLKYLTVLNRWTGLDSEVGLLRGGRDEPRERSLVWREMLAGYDVNDVASLVFRDRFGCWGFLDLWRIGAGEPFSEAEGRLLAGLTQPICAALRRCQARTFDLPTDVADRGGPVVLVLSPELDVRSQTPETEAYLRVLVPPSEHRSPVPAGAYNVAAQLLAVEAGVDHHPPSARVHLAGGAWLTLRAARMGDAGPVDRHDIAVTIESSSPAERMGVFVRAWGLSDREVELVGHLLTGADTGEVAGRMFLSHHTVQDHLKSIFAKTGAHNRRTLLVRVVGR